MDLTKIIDSVRPCVVQIALTSAGHVGRQSIIGTGFLAHSDGYVVTARHVTEALKNHVGTSLRVGLALPYTENMRGNFSFTDAEVVEEDPAHDIALLRMAKNPFAGEMRSGFVIDNAEVSLLYGVGTLAAERPLDGQPIAVSGYPMASMVLVTTSGIVASSWDVTSDDLRGIDEGTASWPSVSDTYIVDVSINPGNSGGPCYRVNDGAIIGVAVAYRHAPLHDATGKPVPGVTQNSGLGLLIPSRYVAQLVTRGVPSST